MKTVFHWWNIAKTFAVVVVAAVVWGLIANSLGLSDAASMLGGMAIGSIGTLACMLRWDLWEFHY